MDFEKFKNNFHVSWHSKIKTFIESKECDNIYLFLKEESKRGKKIAPLSVNVWRCFKETPLDNLKIVLIGPSPYDTIKNDLYVANGLLFSSSDDQETTIELQNFYNQIEKELYNGLNLSYYPNPDVTYLSNQGVLMLGSALSVEIGKTNNHYKLWEPFIKFLFEEIISITGVPVLFIGEDANNYKKYLGSLTQTFDIKNTNNVFRHINKLMYDNNSFGVHWLDCDVPF